MRYFTGLISFSSGPLVAWVNSWLDLFSQTGLAHLHWQVRADDLAAAISTVVALPFVVILHIVSKKTNAIITIVLAVILLTGLGLVWWVRSETSDATEAMVIEEWKERWFIVYVVELVIIAQTIVSAVLWLLRDAAKKETNKPIR